mgnify:CR=1 FL=1
MVTETGQIGSSHALGMIENVRSNQPEDIAMFWSYGYGFGQMDAHRWHAGVLYGYWFAPVEDAPTLKPGFDEFREALEMLWVVEWVNTVSYEPPSIGLEAHGWGRSGPSTSRPRLCMTTVRRESPRAHRNQERDGGLLGTFRIRRNKPLRTPKT